MPLKDVRPLGGATLPAPEPQRRLGEVAFDRPAFQIGIGGEAAPVPAADRPLSMWITRQYQWRSGFEQLVGRNIQRYWHLWRSFDIGPSPGPGQEWRDRTVVPQAFKEIAARVPKIILGLWGQPEAWGVKGRGGRDEQYEEAVRELMDHTLDSIGLNDPQSELFIKRIIDGETYCQVMGHVWWKVFWRKQGDWIKTKIPNPETGKLEDFERYDTIYDNVDILWLPITSIAVDLWASPRRWIIERVRTSLESLTRESEQWEEQTGRPLYPGLQQLELEKLGNQTEDQTDEPRDTEHWPTDDGLISQDPGETPVELWLCWDNVNRTLTKIANRRVVLDHGLAPTPNGLDPYLGEAAIPVPSRPYGESVFHWNQSLYVRQTRLARARMDETLMNLFQQFLVDEGFQPKNQGWFWRPGGMSPIKRRLIHRPLSDHIYLVPRRPMPPEGYNEEVYSQQQSEAVSNADPVTRGGEATSKSRDVSAREISARQTSGDNRYELELLYKRASIQRPMLQRIFDLIRQNMGSERIQKILEDVPVESKNITDLDRPVDITVGDYLSDASAAEKLAEIDRLVAMGKIDTRYANWLKERNILVLMLRSMRSLRRNARDLVKTEEEHATEIQEQMAAQAPVGPGGAVPAQKGPGALPPAAPGGGPPGSAAVDAALSQTMGQGSSPAYEEF